LLQEEDEEDAFVESPAIALFLSPAAPTASSAEHSGRGTASDVADTSPQDFTPRREAASGGSKKAGKKKGAKQKRHSWAGSQTSRSDLEASTPGKSAVESAESGVTLQDDSPW
jgi:hypothetical protein